MIQTYTLDDKFIVYAPDGTIAFDSRIMSQRIHLSGVIVLDGRTTTPAPGGGVILNPSAGVFVPYNKVFSAPPYVLSATRKIEADDVSEELPSSRIYPPRILYREIDSDFYTYLKGAFTNAQTNQVYIGNVNASATVATGPGTTRSWRGTKYAWYAIFENEVG